MLLRRVTALPEGPGWTYEVKWDGYRMQALTDFQPLICAHETLTGLETGGRQSPQSFHAIEIPLWFTT